MMVTVIGRLPRLPSPDAVSMAASPSVPSISGDFAPFTTCPGGVP
jgi:hypothetical protein